MYSVRVYYVLVYYRLSSNHEYAQHGHGATAAFVTTVIPRTANYTYNGKQSNGSVNGLVQKPHSSKHIG